MEGFVVSTGRSLRRGRGSLVNSSRSTGKAPAAKKDSNAQSNVDQEAGEGGEQEGQGDEGDKGDEGDEDDES